MAIDTLASMLRSMGEFALDGETQDAEAFRRDAEGWARHVTVAAPPPSGTGPAAPEGSTPAAAATAGAPPDGGRRDWQGVRQFVREYCRSSARHAVSVAGDLRDTIWVFIRNLNQAFARDEEADARIRQQLERLERLVEASAAAELKREVTETVGALARALEERRSWQQAQMATLGETVKTLGDELESARREGETDALTRVYNRKALGLYLQRTVEMFGAFRHPACLVVIDVDHFKGFNDAHGHLVGDQVLVEVANAIGKVFLRKSDFVARFGGDEFAVVLRETKLEEALPLVERLLARLRAIQVAVGDQPFAVTASIGVAGLEPGDDVNGWFARADRGLYAAKAAGRDRAEPGGPAPLPPAGP